MKGIIPNYMNLLNGTRKDTKLMHGWVIYNGHLKGTKFLEFAEWIKDAGLRQHVGIEIIKNNQLFSIVSRDGNDLIDQAKRKRPDFVIFSDKDIALARQLEQLHIPVFNSAQAIDNSDNKITTYQLLAKKKLPIPTTIIAPKIFPGTKELDKESFSSIESVLSYPVVIKEAYGSFGEQVYLIHNRKELFAKINEISGRPFVFQQYISTSYGKDVRLNVVGDKVVAAMLRTSENDFRANVHVGSSTTSYEPSEREKELAINATQAVGAKFAGVDLLFGEDNEPIICEVNSNAHIRGTYEATGVNVAHHIVRYVIDQIKP